MKNFAEKMWRDYNPHYLFSAYLREIGHDPGGDARQSFIALEKSQPHVNVEGSLSLHITIVTSLSLGMSIFSRLLNTTICSLTAS
jgi:hypothetical protein